MRCAAPAAVTIALFTTVLGCGSANSSSASPADVAFYGGTIQVAAPAGQPGLVLAKIDEIKRVAGVKTAFPVYRFDARTGAVERASVFSSESIVASDPTEAAWSSLKTDYADGHAIDADSSGEVVLGSAMAKELGKTTGGTVSLPLGASAGGVTHSFSVIGILKPTGTAPDHLAYINVTDGQMLLQAALPPPQRDQADATTIATGIDVYAKPGASIGELDKIADQINEQVTGVVATRPSRLLDSIRRSGA
jgi:hypothetical protein